MSKPTVFNYNDYVELKQEYDKLIHTCAKLQKDNDELRNKVANLEIRCRIAEEKI